MAVTHNPVVRPTLTQWKWTCRCGQQERWTTEASARYGARRHVEREARKVAAA